MSHRKSFQERLKRPSAIKMKWRKSYLVKSAISSRVQRQQAVSVNNNKPPTLPNVVNAVKPLSIAQTLSIRKIVKHEKVFLFCKLSHSLITSSWCGKDAFVFISRSHLKDKVFISVTAFERRRIVVSPEISAGVISRITASDWARKKISFWRK